MQRKKHISFDEQETIINSGKIVVRTKKSP